MHLSDTIAAISTPPGTGGISIIRLSGERAVEIADRIFENPLGKKLKNAKTHTITHGFVKKDGKVLDEVLISVMLAPKHLYPRGRCGDKLPRRNRQHT